MTELSVSTTAAGHVPQVPLPEAPPKVTVRNLNFYYGEHHALKNINLTLGTNRVTAFIGPSGCGKSTLLNIVAGLTGATNGGVLLENREVNSPGPDRAVVFQNHSLLPWLTVYENVKLGVDKVFARTKSRAERDAWVMHNLGLVQMAHARDKRPSEISGGMKQRVGIARALAVRPAILLMDEPLSALDSQTRELLMEDFVRLLADGTMGAVYVTHNLEEAVRLADRVVVLSRRPGRIREIVTIPMTRAERGTADARGQMAALQGELWSLIRKEAIDAEREVQHA